MSRKNPELLSKLREDLSNGNLWRCLDVGTDPADLNERWPLMEVSGIRHCSIGLYPSHSASPDWPQQLTILEKKVGELLSLSSGEISPPLLVAIGEIGIDLHWNYSDKTTQSDLFSAQIALANRWNLPILVHNRMADNAILECLKTCCPNRGGIMHCFSSDYDFAVQMVDMGFLISFAGNLTYKSARNLHDTAKRLPLSCLACETDSPYLSPEPLRGTANHPGNVRLVYRELSRLKGVDVETACWQIAYNLETLLSW